MLGFGKRASVDGSKILLSAQHVQTEVHISRLMLPASHLQPITLLLTLLLRLQLPKRLARRLMDLQFLPYIVVTNPNIMKVYNAYFHAFTTLRDMPRVESLEDNEKFSKVLKRLVDEHGAPDTTLPSILWLGVQPPIVWRFCIPLYSLVGVLRMVLLVRRARAVDRTQ